MRKLVTSYAFVASLAVAAPAVAQGVPAEFMQNQRSDVNASAVNGTTQTEAFPHRWDGVPSYLLRKDGTLINGLRPTSPDAQG
jgi:hypothetical protein